MCRVVGLTGTGTLGTVFRVGGRVGDLWGYAPLAKFFQIKTIEFAFVFKFW